MNFFNRGSGSKTRSPPDLVRALRDAILRLENAQTSPDARRKASRTLAFIYLDRRNRQPASSNPSSVWGG